jgi:hypothetical protein
LARVPDLFQGQWWERTDSTAHFYEQIERDIQVPWIRESVIPMENEVPIQEVVDVVIPS